MRSQLLVAAFALVVASCGGSSAPTSAPTALPATSTPVPAGSGDSTDTTDVDPGTTSTTVPADSTSTSTTMTGSASPSTTAIGVDVPADACDAYADLAAARQPRETRDALRRLSIVLALPSPPGLVAAVETLRGRSNVMSQSEALAELDAQLVQLCGSSAGPSFGFESLLAPGVVLVGPDGVRLLDETPLVPADEVETYLAAFGGPDGGLASQVEIQGLGHDGTAARQCGNCRAHAGALH